MTINSIESPKQLSKKAQKFVENIKRATRKALTSAGIAASTMGPMAATSVVPASANTITHIETITSSDINTIGLGTTLNLFAAFNEQDNKISDTEAYTNNHSETIFDAGLSETDATIGENTSTAEAKENSSSINSLEYRPLTITNIDPESLMPKVETGDKNIYKHIEHLRIPEATVVTDMMWKYGAGNYSTEEYQQLMMRLNTGMTMETPKGYDNYEALGTLGEPSYHAHDERNILNTLINHTNFKIANPNYNTERSELLENETKNNPNNIYIFGNSATGETNKEGYLQWDCDSVKTLYKQKNFLLFAAGTNIRDGNDGFLKNQIYQENINETDKHGIYALPSTANGKNDNNVERHLLVTIGTNYNGDIDQTDEFVESSKFPVGFHDKVLFAGRAFPYLSGATNKISGDVGKYATSYTNYFNVAIASILFQMKADTPDVDELLEMVRSTALTDYIRFDLNGDGDTNDIYDGQPESQPLQLMNPAGFFQKYLMPTSLPTKFNINEISPLEKGYYHGVAYQIPGAEVNINGQWVSFTDDNKELIFSQNPMNLKWRINGELLNNYNYKPGDTINGQIIVVDDKWNGLNITKDFSVNIEDTSDINTVTIPYTSNTWYTIDGIRLDAKPTKPGIYIMNGQKIIIK